MSKQTSSHPTIGSSGAAGTINPARPLWQFWLVSVTLLCIGCAPLANGGRLFQITTDRPDNQVTYTLDGQTPIFDIVSPGGIGEATMAWQQGPPPERMLLRLHLRGLEELRLTYDDTVQTLALPSTADGLVRQSIAPLDQQAGGETSITPGDPKWLETRLASSTGEPAIPMQDGYIEVVLPPQVIKQARQAFTVHWVDFFR
ncbi:MAG TPA: hypothetical protein PKE45_21065 [Caldilineaceae bacterium]|nr:hypothetical protein [Caldilineaceae bacterium]